MSAPSLQFSYETQLGDLADQLRSLLRKAFPIVAALLGGTAAWLFVGGRPGAIAFALLSAGVLLVLHVWKLAGTGLPILPMMAVQHLVAYGLPILVRHPVVQFYPPEMVSRAGFEIFLFLVSMTTGWWAALQVVQNGRPTAHMLNIMVDQGLDGLRRIGFWLIGAATAYQALSAVGLLDPVFALLPAGSFPIVFALVSVITSCGLFIESMLLSSGNLTGGQRTAFWAMLAFNAIISASGFLLSATAIVLFSVAIGLFWGSGRIPWRFLAVVGCALAFLNLGKFEMRGLYWSHGEGEAPVESTTLFNMPQRYAEWVEASWTIMTGTEEKTESFWRSHQTEASQKSGQSLLLRVNNLQNILYVIDEMDTGMVRPLGGKTYTIIPALLIPRLFWPDKPRSHEGQVMLNVHFGRQQLESTLVTYIAWGLLAEAYGNFGPLVGSLVVGLVFGFLFGWLEKKSTIKPLLSLEGFVAFIVFVTVANSFEMVASVFITATFQSVAPMVVIGAFLVRRVSLRPA
ncbi:MAG TPA: hypothetical protein VNR00_18710 [Opitutus sp.]|nr:hypothetical protein [Opitutus sp.]